MPRNDFINVDGAINYDNIASSSQNFINVKYPPSPLVGAKGDGVADDTSSINNILSTYGGKTIFFPNGTYIINNTLVVSSGTKLVGDNTILKAGSSLSSNSPILRNLTTTGLVDTYYDSDITIKKIIFDGNNTTRTTTEFISMVKIQRILFTECQIKNTLYIGIALGGCHFVTIEKCYFTNTGKTSITAEGGAAIWVSTLGDGSKCKNIIIDKCYFENLNWSAIYFHPNEGTVSNCKIINAKEGGIFSNNTSSNLKFINNFIYGTTRMYISSSGLECGASGVEIIGNIIQNNQSDGISLTDTHDVIIGNNICENNGQDNITFSTASGIGIITTQTSPNQPDNIKINNNICRDIQVTPTQIYGIVIGNIGSAVTNVSITNNNLSANKTASIYMASGKWGANCYSVNNIGDASFSPKVGQFNAPATTGNFSVTGLGFKPRLLEFSSILAGAAKLSISKVSANLSVANAIAILGSASSGTTVQHAIYNIDETGAIICDATLVSLDQDGFTLNFTNVAARPWIMYTAHP